MKRILPILSIILFTALRSQGQEERSAPPPDEKQSILREPYPNPAISFIKFEFQKDYSKGYSLHIINFVGKQVFEAKNINISTNVDLSSYARGVYIYQLKDASGKVAKSGKFQVSR